MPPIATDATDGGFELHPHFNIRNALSRTKRQECEDNSERDLLWTFINTARHTLATVFGSSRSPRISLQSIEIDLDSGPAFIGYGKHPSGSSFRSNEVRLWLSVIAYNLGNLWRRLVLPQRIGNWSLTSLQQRLVKTGGRLVKHVRYYWLLLAESRLTRRLFASMARRIEALPVPTG